MTKSPEVIKDWLEQIYENSHKLSTWEIDFFNSVSDQFAVSGTVSDKQEEILERIYADKT